MGPGSCWDMGHSYTPLPTNSPPGSPCVLPGTGLIDGMDELEFQHVGFHLCCSQSTTRQADPINGQTTGCPRPSLLLHKPNPLPLGSLSCDFICKASHLGGDRQGSEQQAGGLCSQGGQGTNLPSWLSPAWGTPARRHGWLKELTVPRQISEIAQPISTDSV